MTAKIAYQINGVVQSVNPPLQVSHIGTDVNSGVRRETNDLNYYIDYSYYRAVFI